MSGGQGRKEPTIVPFPRKALDSGSGPTDPPDIMAMRVARLEDDVKDLRSDMKTAVRDLSFMRGRLEHLPTTWVLIGTIAASQVTLLGFVFAMLKFLSHP